LLWFAPIAMSIASIGLYQYLNEDFIIEDVFSSLGIFTSFKVLLRNLPNTLDVFMETLISLDRVEKFLALPDIDDTNVEKYDDITMKKKIALQITNGNFTWNRNYQPEKSKISERLNINIHEEEKTDNKNKINIKRKRRKTIIGIPLNPEINNKKAEFFSSDESSNDNNLNLDEEDNIEKKEKNPEKKTMKMLYH
jgi:hypothetical protein